MEFDVEWGREGLQSAARNRILTAEAIAVLFAPTTVLIETPVGL